ncbi:MAG: hypothetical protein ACTSU5_02200 [Promethearchaeota archaeon]
MQHSEGKSREWFLEQVEKFKAAIPAYQWLVGVLKGVLGGMAKSVGLHAMIQGRAKGLASFAEKIIRPGKDYRDPINEITDLCGIRVILSNLDELERYCRMLESNFVVHWEDSEDKLQKLDVSQFGYLSNHYIVQLREDSEFAPAGGFPQELLPLKAEVQVRTVLQHAWAQVNHSIGYKNKVKLPARVRRQFFRMAAILENADDEFRQIVDDARVYEANYGAYMSREEIAEEVSRLERVMEVAPEGPNKRELAIRVAKLARYLGDWDLVVEKLSPLAGSGDADVLRELGIATCKRASPGTAEFETGQGYLREAVRLNPEDSDALASLGGTWKGTRPELALEYYRKAYEANPGDSYAVGNYLVNQIAATGDTSLLAYSLPVLRSVVERCDRQVKLEINYPWAFFDEGLFLGLLGEANASFSAYLGGVRYSTEAWMVATTLGTLDVLRDLDAELPSFVAARRLLLLSLACRFGDESAKGRLLEECSPVDTNLRAPVVVVAGSTARSAREKLESIRGAVVAGFRGFSGTVVSGGTTSGVAGLVGELGETHGGSLTAVGYLPAELPAGLGIHPGYARVHRTRGPDFSALEPLQYWVDIMGSGLCPLDVKVLGVGGGQLSALEYRLALALGARVGVVESSGGEAARVFLDVHWSDLGNLTRVASSAEGIAGFVGAGGRRTGGC